MKYRLYIDEVGNHDLGKCDNFDNRFLSLTGVLISLSHVREVVHPEMERLKYVHFGHHPDNLPLIFHRKELVNANHPFEKLRDLDNREHFNKDFLDHLARWKYKVFSVCIDKKTHRDGYIWQYPPYHYCLEVLMEKCVQYLARIPSSKLDVMIEARTKPLDKALKKCYKNIYDCGTTYVNSDRYKHFLTSNEIKIKPKIMNIAGLQLADLIAHPSNKEILADFGVLNDNGIPVKIAPFAKEICGVLQNKYDQWNGNIYGKKFIQK